MLAVSPYVRNVGSELKNKVDVLRIDVDALQQSPGTQGATVGTGGAYASIQEALDAGETKLVVISDLEVASDLTAGGISLGIVVDGSNTVTFLNASFKAGNGFDNVSLSGSVPIPVMAGIGAGAPGYGANVVINYTAGSHTNTGVLQGLDGAVISNVSVTDVSTQDGAFLCRNCTDVRVEHVFYDITEPGAARTLAGVAGVDNISVQHSHTHRSLQHGAGHVC